VFAKTFPCPKNGKFLPIKLAITYFEKPILRSIFWHKTATFGVKIAEAFANN
jgi:hypothetical protein